MERRINKEVELSKIVFDEELYPRSNPNWQTSYDYANSIQAGAKFPPIVLAVYNKKLILIDGKHRIDAHVQLKLKTIKTEIFTGWDKKRIYIEAVKRNIAHGRILSPFEKRSIALKLRGMKMKEGEISDIIQVPMERMEKFVGSRLVNSLTGKAIVKSEIKHIGGSFLTDDQLNNLTSSQKKMRSTSQIGLLEQVVIILEEDLVDISNKKVVKLLKKIKLLLEKGV